MWWGYYEWGGERFVGTEGNWSFGYDLCDERVCNMDPSSLIATYKGEKEQAAVTPAQHPISIVGKSWTRDKKEPKLNDRDMPEPTYVPWLGKVVDDPTAYGIYFQDRWDEALKEDPQFLYLNDWNEWSAGKYKSGKAPGSESPGPTDFLGRKNPFYFVDQYNAEFNRTIQPMKGGYTDNYYMQMAQNIRRYKGVRPIPENRGYQKMSIDGQFDKWKKIKIEYRDTKGDITHRDYKGYGGNHYINNSGRNDIVLSKVAVDKENVYFYVQTANPITSSTDPNWMLLLIDADNNYSTGWYGYDYLINQSVVDNTSTQIKWYDNTKNEWVKKNVLAYKAKGNCLELAVSRKDLGLLEDTFVFDFKWADNPKELKDPISLCTDGDTAPNRRFNYRCIWKK